MDALAADVRATANSNSLATTSSPSPNYNQSGSSSVSGSSPATPLPAVSTAVVSETRPTHATNTAVKRPSSTSDAAMPFNSNKRPRPVDVITIDDDEPELISLLSDDEDADTQLVAVSPARSRLAQRPKPVFPASFAIRNSPMQNSPMQAGQSAQRGGSGGFDTFVGTVNTLVVGCQYYRDVEMPNDGKVRIIRNPENLYDKNAFRVDNHRGQQIGSLPREIAARFAPYVDRGDLVIKGRLMGPRGGFDIPLELMLYTFRERLIDLNIEFARKGVQFTPATSRGRPGMPSVPSLPPMPAGTAWPNEILGARQFGDGLSGLQGQPHMYSNNPFTALLHGAANVVNNIAHGLGAEGIADELGMVGMGVGEAGTRGLSNARYGHTEETLKVLPRASQPDRVVTKMLDYQLQGLGWLIQHEHQQLSKKKSSPSQFWVYAGGDRYWNSMTNQYTRNPELFSGGILADDMGLGKTIQLISLICSDPNKAVEKELIKANTTPEKYEGKPTLILCPVGLMSNWSGQMGMHVDAEHPLRILVFHGANKLPNVRFTDYDIVITSYGSITREYKEIEAIENPDKLKAVNRTPRNMRILEQPWRRVILDEAHVIRNPSTKVALGVVRIDAYSRWALTGTPIVNSLNDLFSLIRFFKMPGGLTDRAVFDRVITRGFNIKNGESETRLQALMMSLCLRRLKSMDSIVKLNLPPLNEYMHTIEWTTAERQVYDAMEREAQGVMAMWRDAEDGQGNAKYIYLLEALLRLRQICNHKGLCGERLKGIADIADQAVVEATHENILALQLLLQAAVDNDEECPICFERLGQHSPRITLCKHVFGQDCIEETIKVHGSCPLCRAELKDAKACLVAPTDETKTSDIVIDKDSSSKLEAIMKILITTKQQNDAAGDGNPVKTLVFSQWTSFLDIVQVRLVEAGIGFTRIDGKMNVPERDQSIVRLNTDRKVTVMLASLAVSSTGLNLVAASQIIMSDLWWNTAQERQAVDRCYRLGQTRPVNVFRLVMKNSIEQRVIAIQDEKVELVERALNDGRKTVKSKDARLADIERLLTSSEHRKTTAPATLMNPQDERRKRERRENARKLAKTAEAKQREQDEDDDDLDGFIVADDESSDDEGAHATSKSDESEDEGAAVHAISKSDDSEDEDLVPVRTSDLLKQLVKGTT